MYKPNIVSGLSVAETCVTIEHAKKMVSMVKKKNRGEWNLSGRIIYQQEGTKSLLSLRVVMFLSKKGFQRESELPVSFRQGTSISL